MGHLSSAWRAGVAACRGRRGVTALGVTLAAALAALMVRRYSGEQVVSDDAYITYRYALNVGRGYGFVFNPGAPPVLGTSTPLYTLLLAAGAAVGLDVPALSLLVGALGFAAALGLVTLLAADLGVLGAGLAVAVTWSLSPLSWASVAGMETPLYMALISGAVWAAGRGHAGPALLLAALACLARLDGLAVLAAVSACLVVTRRWSWPAVLPAALLLATWSVLALAWFGSPVPSSGLAKIVHEDGVSGRFEPLSPVFLYLAVPISRLLLAQEPAVLRLLTPLVLAGVIGGALAVRRPVAAATLLLWLALYAAGLRSLGLPDFRWYYAPMALTGALLCWVAVAGAVRAGLRCLTWPGLPRPLRALGARAAAAAGGAVLLGAIAVSVPVAGAGDPDAGKEWPAQQWAGEWLREHARPGDTVAAYEIGKVAYFSGLTTIDVLGLTEPRARGFVRERDYAWAVRTGPDYVFANEHLGWVVTGALFRSCEFVRGYVPAQRFPFRAGLDYVLYERWERRGSAEPQGGGEAIWLDTYAPGSLRASSSGAYSVVVQNASAAPWQAGGPGAVSVGYRWLGADGLPVGADGQDGQEGQRTPVPCTVPPGERVLVSALVRAPDAPGTYFLQWDVFRAADGWLGGPPPPARRVRVD